MEFEAKIYNPRKKRNFWWNFHFYFWYALVQFQMNQKLLMNRKLKHQKWSHRKLKGWRMQFMRRWWLLNGPEKIGSDFKSLSWCLTWIHGPKSWPTRTSEIFEKADRSKPRTKNFSIAVVRGSLTWIQILLKIWKIRRRFKDRLMFNQFYIADNQICEAVIAVYRTKDPMG